MTCSLRFLNGVRTVGGVQVLAGGTGGKLLCDLGVVGNPAIVRREALFHELLPARGDNVLLDYLRAGMAPLVENLYHPRYLPGPVAAAVAPLRSSGHLLAGFPLIEDVAPGEICVFISHLHDDHMRLLPYLAPEVRVLTSPETARLHRALVRAGTLAPTQARIVPVRPGQVEAVGDLTVEVISVDHDIPGSAGVLITTPDGERAAYTGDWRLHGRHPTAMAEFAQRCSGVDVLITEASLVAGPGPRPPALMNIAEPDIAPRLDAVLKTARRGAYYSTEERNLERQADIRASAQACGRTLVLSRRSYAIWHAAAAEGFESLAPGPDVAVWSTDGDPAGSRYPVPPGSPTVAVADVAADPAAYLCEIRHYDRPLLLEIGAGPPDVYLYLNGYPYGPADPGWAVLQTWVGKLDLRFEILSSHGHALPDALCWLIDEARPQLVVPVHTNAPERFPACTVPVRPVERGDQIVLGRAWPLDRVEVS